MLPVKTALWWVWFLLALRQKTSSNSGPYLVSVVNVITGGKVGVVCVCVCVFQLPVPAAEPHPSGVLAAEQTGQSYFLAGVPLFSSPQPFTVTQGSKWWGHAEHADVCNISLIWTLSYGHTWLWFVWDRACSLCTWHQFLCVQKDT